MALRTIAAWPRESWPDGTEARIRAMAWRDPGKRVRDRARAVADGKSLG